MKDLQKVIAVGIGVVGVIAAARVLKSRVKTVEEKGLSLTTAGLLLIAGYTLYTRLDDTVEDFKELRA